MTVHSTAILPARPKIRVPSLEQPRLHVVLVHGEWVSSGPFGGIARYLDHLARGLQANGHSVTVITVGPEHSETTEGTVRVIRIRRPIGVPERPIRWLVPLLLSLRFARAIRRLREREDVDIVEFSNYGAAGFAHAFHKTGLHVTRVSTMGWQSDSAGKSAGRLADAVKRRWDEFLEAAPIRRSDLVITPSPSHALTVAKRLNLAAMPTPIAHGTSSPHDETPAETSKSLLFVGRLEPRKGLDTLIEAFTLAMSDLDPDVTLTLVGADTNTGPEGMSYRDHLLGACSRDVQARLRLAGWVSDEDLANLYATCAAVLIPSRYESFGLAAIEAMRYGKAVIASEVGGLSDVVTNGVQGLLVPYGDVRALADAIIRTANDRALRDRLGKNGLERFNHEFTIEAFVERTEDAYYGSLSLNRTMP